MQPQCEYVKSRGRCRRRTGQSVTVNGRERFVCKGHVRFVTWANGREHWIVERWLTPLEVSEVAS